MLVFSVFRIDQNFVSFVLLASCPVQQSVYAKWAVSVRKRARAFASLLPVLVLVVFQRQLL